MDYTELITSKQPEHNYNTDMLVGGQRINVDGGDLKFLHFHPAQDQHFPFRVVGLSFTHLINVVFRSDDAS